MRTELDEGPRAADDDAESDEHEPESHRTGDQVVQAAEGRQAIEQPAALLALELPFLNQIEERGDRRERKTGVAEKYEHHVQQQPCVAHPYVPPRLDREFHRPDLTH